MHVMLTCCHMAQRHQAGPHLAATLLMTDQPGVIADHTIMKATCTSTLMLSVHSMADQAVMAGLQTGFLAQGRGQTGQGMMIMRGGLAAGVMWASHQLGWRREASTQVSQGRDTDNRKLIRVLWLRQGNF